MFAFTAVLLFAAAQPPAQVETKSESKLTSAKNLVIAAGDDELLKLRKELFNTVLAEYHCREKMIESGKFELSTLGIHIACIDRLWSASKDCHSAAEFLSFTKDRVSVHKAFEKMLGDRRAAGTIPEQDVHSARSARLEAEIELIRLERAAAAATPAIPTPVVNCDCAPPITTNIETIYVRVFGRPHPLDRAGTSCGTVFSVQTPFRETVGRHRR